MPKLQNKIALVTGASRGIGEAVAKAFAKEGAHVIAVARTVGALEALDDAIQNAGGSATLVPLDLRDGKKIDELGGIIAERWGKLDILVGNAGMLGPLSPVGHISPDAWERVIATNLTANWRLLRSLDPLLRASDAGRAMFVTSGVAGMVSPYWSAYSTSKAGLEMLIKIYAAEVAHTNIKANLIDPGEIRTRMHAEASPGLDPNLLPPPESITGTFIELAQASCRTHGEVVRAYPQEKAA